MLCVKILEEIADAREAIWLSCEILQKQGIVEGRYYQAILKNIERYGGYFYLGKGICMPHARVEDGALKSGICILILKKSVAFFGNRVNIFMTLAAGDEEEHLENLQKIMGICNDEDKMLKIAASDDEEQLLKLIGG